MRLAVTAQNQTAVQSRRSFALERMSTLGLFERFRATLAVMVCPPPGAGVSPRSARLRSLGSHPTGQAAAGAGSTCVVMLSTTCTVQGLILCGTPTPVSNHGCTPARARCWWARLASRQCCCRRCVFGLGRRGAVVAASLDLSAFEISCEQEANAIQLPVLLASPRAPNTRPAFRLSWPANRTLSGTQCTLLFLSQALSLGHLSSLPIFSPHTDATVGHHYTANATSWHTLSQTRLQACGLPVGVLMPHAMPYHALCPISSLLFLYSRLARKFTVCMP